MEHAESVLVPLIFFGFLGSIVIVPRIFKSKERVEMQRTIRAAIERGQPLPPEMIDAMTRNVRPAYSSGRDLRTGLVWLCVGLGLAAFGWILGFEPDAEDARYPLLAIGAIPAFIGVAFLILAVLHRGRQD